VVVPVASDRFLLHLLKTLDGRHAIGYLKNQPTAMLSGDFPFHHGDARSA